MLSLNIRSDDIYLNDIKPEDLPKILDWYNRVDEFIFATGSDKLITIKQLFQEYVRNSAGNNKFFTGIYNSSGALVGFMKGNLNQSRNRAVVWISSIAIDSAFRNRGYGSAAVNLLLEFLKCNYSIEKAYLAVVEENIKGRMFWAKNRFKVLRKLENSVSLRDRQHNIVIMYKPVK